MNAFDQLNAALEQQPLSRSLPRLLSIANRIDASDLAKWVGLELGGYLNTNPQLGDDDVVPEYRTVVGTWYDDWGRMFVLRPDQSNLSFLNELRMREGVAELEALVSAVGPLSTRPGDFAAIINESLDIGVTTFEFDPRSVAQVVSNIRVEAIRRAAAHRDLIAAIVVGPVPQTGEIIQLKPGIYGVSVDLKALWRRVFKGRG